MIYLEICLFLWILFGLTFAIIISNIGIFYDFFIKYKILFNIIYFPFVVLIYIVGKINNLCLFIFNKIYIHKYITIIILCILFLIGLFYCQYDIYKENKCVKNNKIIECINQPFNDFRDLKNDLEEYILNAEEKQKKNKVENLKTVEIWLKDTNGSHLKYYEDYRMITDTTSKQWEFQQKTNVYEDYRGFLMENEEWYAVALGSYFGDIGTKYIFTMSTGNKIKIVKGDFKSDADTCEDNYLSYNGHILEFMINPDNQWMIENEIPSLNFINYEPFQGDIVKIEKVIT